MVDPRTVANEADESHGNRTRITHPDGKYFEYQGTTTGSTRFLYDGDRLIVEYDGGGVLKRRYVHGAGVDEPLVWYEGSGVSATTRRHLHADHQGSIVATANSAGAKLEIGTYDAYGVSTAPSSWRFQYTGQTFISSIGLYYYKARFYNPSLGRFMQTDPIGYDDDVNLYAYVANDPLNMTDPRGAAAEGNSCSRVGAESCSGSYATAGRAQKNDKDKNQDPTKISSNKSTAQQAAELLWPGYDLGTCMSSAGDCSAADWAIGGIGVIPGGKAGSLGIKGLLKGLKIGSSEKIRLVGSFSELRNLFDDISAGAKQIDAKNYKGTMMEHPDGTRIGLRSESKSGGAAIDVHYSDGSRATVHIEGGGK